MEAGTMAPPDPATRNGAAGDVDLEGEGDEHVEERAELVIEGDGQLSLAVGGKNPTVSKIILRGGQIPFTGQLRKGEHLALRVELRCAEVHLIDKIDSTTREVTETVRKHVLKVEGAERMEEE